jgi:urocanate hydratase
LGAEGGKVTMADAANDGGLEVRTRDGGKKTLPPTTLSAFSASFRGALLRQGDAGYDDAIDCARERGVDLPMITTSHGKEPQQ